MIASTELYKEMCFKNISFFFSASVHVSFLLWIYHSNDPNDAWLLSQSTTMWKKGMWTLAPQTEKTNLMAWAVNEDSYQHAHPRRLIWVFVVRIWNNFASWLSKMRRVKILMRLCEWTRWSESLLSPHVRRYAFWAYGSFDPHLDKMYLSNMRTTKAQGRLLINRYENKPIQI